MRSARARCEASRALRIGRRGFGPVRARGAARR
ncbi:type III secretion system protein [Burkholderia sp. ABCPW 14]|uniref:Type III secretion system protein n=1 Tax=Burkholderia mayonis TaxID=1385591 RepID=A0A1B4FS63_9BURK|nr:type III secretion system protein [Burkholderia mayonis]KVD86574.1 type III secretion system protein [Burkholderia sp. ABCPW 14]KVE51249.1 type III secretion system protein [Burkholderia mayonis]